MPHILWPASYLKNLSISLLSREEEGRKEGERTYVSVLFEPPVDWRERVGGEIWRWLSI